ncbi:hypothetical protein DFJ63DRAFT_97902 [Scheffersomyces coipomensis]|uniref:uncharacterized protein n=1 Tax=Scheffersomyces coipomensis TaxID=1788519 RepID=UPI00315C961D
MEVDSSFDNSSIQNVLENDDYKVDLSNLINDILPIPTPNDVQIKQDLESSHSPPKKLRHLNDFLSSNNNNNKAHTFDFNTVLRPNLKETNQITNELFQVTNQLRRSTDHQSTIMSDFNNNSQDDTYDEIFFSNKRLNNDKVEKLVDNLFSKHGGSISTPETFDFELDDQLRTRFFKGRFNKNQFSIESNDELDVQLSNFLSRSTSPSIPINKKNDNKENISPSPDPLKSVHKKAANSIKKSHKTFFRPPPPNEKNQHRQSIPVLKPISNLSNTDNNKRTDISFLDENNWSSGKRICSPKHRRHLTPRKPSIKYSDINNNIFLVESSTGLVNDATRFGTELNSSNCEDFPLPEDANEIVQIPTNEDPKTKKQKLAIIKVIPKLVISEPKQGGANDNDNLKGFYNESEYKRYNGNNVSLVVHSEDSGVEVVSQSLPSFNIHNDFAASSSSSSTNNTKRRKVRWAEKLEW